MNSRRCNPLINQHHSHQGDHRDNHQDNPQISLQVNHLANLPSSQHAVPLRSRRGNRTVLHPGNLRANQRASLRPSLFLCLRCNLRHSHPPSQHRYPHSLAANLLGNRPGNPHHVLLPSQLLFLHGNHHHNHRYNRLHNLYLIQAGSHHVNQRVNPVWRQQRGLQQVFLHHFLVVILRILHQPLYRPNPELL